jgi:hypothetical protein
MNGTAAVLLAAGFSGIALAPHARAESISLSCTAGFFPNKPILTLIVNVDLATSSVSEGSVADQGTRWGPYAAQISTQVIAWDTGPIWHVTISRVTGEMRRRGQAGSDIHYSCSEIRSPKQKF